jgi:hypothetical protein
MKQGFRKHLQNGGQEEERERDRQPISSLPKVCRVKNIIQARKKKRKKERKKEKRKGKKEKKRLTIKKLNCSFGGLSGRAVQDVSLRPLAC